MCKLTELNGPECYLCLPSGWAYPTNYKSDWFYKTTLCVALLAQ